MTRIIAVATVMAALLAGCHADATSSELDRARLQATKIATAGPDPAATSVTLLGQIGGTKGGKKQTDYTFAWAARSGQFCFARVNASGTRTSQCQGAVADTSIDVQTGSYCSTIGVWGQAGATVASVQLEAGQLVASAPVVRVGTRNGTDYYGYFVSMNVATTKPIEVTVTATNAAGTPVQSEPVTGPAGDC